MEVTFNNFYEFADWIHKSEKHREELEHENIELTRENMKLKREIDKLKKSQVEYINQILKKSPAATEDVPKIFKSIK